MPAVVLWSSFCRLFRSSLGALLVNVALFRVFRAFLARFYCSAWVCLSWCFLWLVWLLCACGVRRLYDLWRVCLRFSFSLSVFLSFVLCFISLPCLLSCFALVVFCLSSFLLCLFLCACGSLCFLFPLRIYRQKERAQSVFASSLFVGYLYSNILYIFHSFTSVAFSSAKE